MLRIAHEDGKIQNPPVIRPLKEPGARKGFVPLEKFEELIGLLPTGLRPLITFLYYCGGRVGEALQIEWTQVDLNARLIRLEPEQTKTDEARSAPTAIHTGEHAARNSPQSWLGIRGPESAEGVAEGLRRVRAGPYRRCARQEARPTIRWANNPRLAAECSRNLVTIAGVPERIAMKISGHKTRSVFDRYHIVSTEDVTAAMQRMELAAANLLPQPNGAKLGKKAGRTNRKSLMALSSRG